MIELINTLFNLNPNLKSLIINSVLIRRDVWGLVMEMLANNAHCSSHKNWKVI